MINLGKDPTATVRILETRQVSRFSSFHSAVAPLEDESLAEGAKSHKPESADRNERLESEQQA